MDGAQSTVPTKKSVPALKGGVRLENQSAGENTDSQIDLFPWPLGSWSSADVMHLRSHASTLSHIYALTHLRSHTILTSDAALHFSACLSLCKLTVQTENPKRSGIRKLSSFSVMPHPPRVSCNALYLRCRLTKHIACNHLQAICVGYMWDGCGLLV